MRAAAVVDVLPTPLDAVARAVNIAEIIDISQLPAELHVRRPHLVKRLLGAILFRERTVFIDRTLSEPRQRFTQGHEIGHGIIPWHAATYRLDDERTLLPETKDAMEAQASLAAAHLLFQGPSRFYKRALEYEVGIGAPLALADEYAASRHATMRYYTENHPDAVELVVTGQYPSVADGTIPVYDCVESASFRREFGSLSRFFPTATTAFAGGDGKPFGDILHASRSALDVPSKKVGLRDLEGEARAMVAEAFCNGYNFFVLLAPHRRVHLGRRLRVETRTAS